MNCFCTLNFEAYVAEPAFFSGHRSRVKLWTLVCFEVTTAAAPAFIADHINLNSCLRMISKSIFPYALILEQKLQCLRVLAVGEVLQVTVLWDKLADEEDGDYHSRGAFDTRFRTLTIS